MVIDPPNSSMSTVQAGLVFDSLLSWRARLKWMEEGEGYLIEFTIGQWITGSSSCPSSSSLFPTYMLRSMIYALPVTHHFCMPG